MIRIDQLKVKIGSVDADLETVIAERLRIKKSDITGFGIIRKSIDARKKPELYYVYTVSVSVCEEKKILKHFASDRNISEYEPVIYTLPECGEEKIIERPVIVGAGPAGLFCAYELAVRGFKPLVIERGKRVDERIADIEEFWKTGALDPFSNVQFGEGGAGTFSDGKLTTSIKDKNGRIGEVLRIFADNGAPEEITYEHMPHIGTDLLRDIIRNIREKIISLGGEFKFSTTLTGIEKDETGITGCLVNEKGNEYRIGCSLLILATGHSARDTYRMLYDCGVNMSPKPFAAGFRVIHPQKMIDSSQYGDPSFAELLGAAPYKLTAESDGRGVFSFCMCPGGFVVNSSSEDGGTVVNGMSCSRRDSGYANSAIVVSVPVSDYPGDHPLSGIDYQLRLEKKAYELAKGKIPVQRYGDFRSAVEGSDFDESGCSDLFEGFKPGDGIKGDFEYCDLSGIFDDGINHAFINGMERFGRIISGFNDSSVIMAGVESRTSSPVRIERDESMNSNVNGLIPVGEGAGYAGGITSAAIDGFKAAEYIINRFDPENIG